MACFFFRIKKLHLNSLQIKGKHSYISCSLSDLSLTTEISQRIQTAHPAGRQVLLHYLLPWMNNIELVDLKPLPTARQHDEDEEDSLKDRELMVTSRRWLRGEGWGSPQATAMVLNNLMYMTAKVTGFVFVVPAQNY